MGFNLIVALCKNNGIGKNGDIPWKITKDLKYFKDVTSFNKTSGENVVIMGRKTWESIPEKFKPLSNRINIVLSKTLSDTSLKDYNNTFVYKSLNDVLSMSYQKSNIFVIGGGQIYEEAIKHPMCDKLYITEIYKDYECDTFFPDYKDMQFYLTNVSQFHYDQSSNVYFRYLILTSQKMLNSTKGLTWKNLEEEMYLNTLNEILNDGIEKKDRTGVGTLSVFGKYYKYDLRDHFPMITTKRMFLRGIFEELALYISGKTDNKILQDKGIHIWDGNTSREFLDKRGLNDYEEGDMGETYGFNFRHYGAEYKGCQYDYTGQGYDQLENVLKQIRTNPSSRRMIINLFNPATQHKAALPACLCQYQFHVDTHDKLLNLQIYIRSSDYFLANNWNACTGALLVHLICNLNDIDLKPGFLTVITGDTHIYLNHIDGVKKNLERDPRPPGKLIIKEKKDDLRDFTFDDIEIVGYKPYPGIKVDMAV